VPSRKFNVGIKGLIVRDNRVLTLVSGSFRDLPGGRIDDVETSRAALLRELAEELPGIRNVRIGPLLGCERVADLRDDLSLFLVAYQVDADLPEPIALSAEHSHAEWLPLELAEQVFSKVSIDWGRLVR
jgi:8-oxo-dGTP pyrophosphatase MutT (NUDIX family)